MIVGMSLVIFSSAIVGAFATARAIVGTPATARIAIANVGAGVTMNANVPSASAPAPIVIANTRAIVTKTASSAPSTVITASRMGSRRGLLLPHLHSLP